jgi:hypothetical protein
MANDTNQITLADGTSISIPAWASESTLKAMVMMAQRSNVLTKSMLKGIEVNKNVDEATLGAIKEAIDGVKTNTETNKEQAKNKSSMLIKTAENIKNTATFFGDSEKPLSSLVRSAENLVKKLDGPTGKGGFAALAKKWPAFGSAISGVAGQVIGVASDVILALAGWNAAKFEQFAEVQKKMIDSGAIMYETGDVFDQLYKDSFQAGVTYNMLGDVVANFGGTMTAIGGDVSKGTQGFLRMFKSLSYATDDLGDLGMLNKEMMETYANYIETQRLTGALDRKLANSGEGLESSFTNLVVESTAMASLTALNRNDILQRQMAALSDPFLAAGAQTLRDQGLDKTANVAESLMTQLSLFSDVGPGAGIMAELSESFNRNLNEFSSNIENFQIETGMTNETRSAFDTAMPGFLGRINDMVQNGEMTTETARNFMLKEFDKMDLERLATAGVEGGTPLKLIQELQASGILIKKNFGEWIDLSLKEIEDIVNKTKTKLDNSGTTTKAMNDMAKMFLSAQEFITMPMNWFADALEVVTDSLNKYSSSGNELTNSLSEMIMLDNVEKQNIDGLREKDDGGTNNKNDDNSIGGTRLSNNRIAHSIIYGGNTATLSEPDKKSLNNQLTDYEKEVNMLSESDNVEDNLRKIYRIQQQIANINEAMRISNLNIKNMEDKKAQDDIKKRYEDTSQIVPGL